MQKFVLTLVAALLVQLSEAGAQSGAEISLVNFNRSAGTFSFDVRARRTGTSTGSVLIGISSFFIDYNSAALSSPTLGYVNSQLSGPPDHTGDYDPMTIQILAGKIAVTVRFTGNSTGSAQALTPDGERVCTVNMAIVELSAPANVSWDNSNSTLTDVRSMLVENSFMESENTLLAVQPALPATRETAPLVLALHQNYPNPFNPTTTIRFALPTTTPVQLEIYNITGQRVVTLVNEVRQAGYYNEHFDANNIASGVYIYRMQAGKFTDAKMLMVLK